MRLKGLSESLFNIQIMFWESCAIDGRRRLVPTRQLTDELTAAGERERVVGQRGESRIAH